MYICSRREPQNANKNQLDGCYFSAIYGMRIFIILKLSGETEFVCLYVFVVTHRNWRLCVPEKYFNFSSAFFSKNNKKKLWYFENRESLCENSKTVIYLCSLCFILFHLVWFGFLFSFANTQTMTEVNIEKFFSDYCTSYVRTSVCLHLCL